MNREQRVEKWAELVVWAKKRECPMFGVYHAQKVITGEAYHRPRGYAYRLALQVLSEAVSAGVICQYTTSQNENVYCLAIRS